MRVVLTTLNAKYIHSSLALRYLKAYCVESSKDICIKEYTINNNLLEILSDIYGEKPDIIGMACYIWNIDMTLALANLIKKVLPQSIIILGGPEVSYDSTELLEQHGFIDYIIQGEGEETLRLLLASLAQGQTTDEISGLTVRRNDEIIKFEGAQFIEDLNTIPFPYTEDEMKGLQHKIIYYESSRGCPFVCQYCLSSATQGVRFLELERVYQDMLFFIRHDVKQVKFVDRTFNARKTHFFPLLKFLARQECRTNFHFEIAIDLLDEEVVDFLKNVKPGRFQFEVGIQSTYLPALKAVRRNNHWDKIVHHIEKIKSYENIHLHLDLIVGLPHESYASFAHSFNAVYALKPDMLQIGFLKLLKGSGIRESASRHCYIYMDNAPYEVLANDCLCYEEIRRLKLLEDIFEQTYNSGAFPYTLAWFIKMADHNAFSFYEKLTFFSEKSNWQLNAHNNKALLQLLIDFCGYHYPDQVATCYEFLKFDVLLSENQTRPDILPWNGEQWKQETSDFWRDETKVQKYLPGYKFINWRQLKKQYHIEIFSLDVPDELTVTQANKKIVPVLFSYNETGVDFQYINYRDLWPEGDFC